MSKKKEIVELLKKGTDVEEICTELGVSTSYVYRIKREMEESEGNQEESNDSETNTPGDMVIDSTGGNSTDVEGDNENMEEEENEGETSKPGSMGGVKKRKKRVKKEKKEEDNGGLLKWIQKKWKQMLLILTLLILLIVAMLKSSPKELKETTPNTWETPSRFPRVIR